MWLLLFILCSTGLIASKHEKKYHVSICALFKNESKNIKEWIEYHRLIGVDHFYLYENGANDGYMKVLRPYINSKVVTFIPWPDNIPKQDGENLFKWSLSTQIPAYENALILHAKKETDWLVFLDIDEFLLPVDQTLTELLEEYKDHPGIEIRTECFEASGSMTPTKHLVIESVDITTAPKTDVVETVKKVIFKPELSVGAFWAPYSCIFANDQKAIQLDSNKIRVNRYLNRNKKTISMKRKLYVDQRNTRRNEIEDILNSGFDIEDQQREIYRFVPEVTKRLSLQN